MDIFLSVELGFISNDILFDTTKNFVCATYPFSYCPSVDKIGHTCWTDLN